MEITSNSQAEELENVTTISDNNANTTSNNNATTISDSSNDTTSNDIEIQKVIDKQLRMEKIARVYYMLKGLVSPPFSQQNRGTYEFAKLQAIYFYLGRLLMGDRKIEASTAAAKIFWSVATTTYRGRMIRKKAKQLIQSNDAVNELNLIESRKEKHSKRGISILDNDRSAKRKV